MQKNHEPWHTVANSLFVRDYKFIYVHGYLQCNALEIMVSPPTSLHLHYIKLSPEMDNTFGMSHNNINILLM